MAFEILSNEQKRAEYDQYKGRSYYENQYQESHKGEEEGGGSKWEYKGDQGEWDKDRYRAKFSGYEWYLVTPSQLMFWGVVGSISENFYE